MIAQALDRIRRYDHPESRPQFCSCFGQILPFVGVDKIIEASRNQSDAANLVGSLGRKVSVEHNAISRDVHRISIAAPRLTIPYFVGDRAALLVDFHTMNFAITDSDSVFTPQPIRFNLLDSPVFQL